MGGYDPGEVSHQALRGIRRELERHPAVESVQGFPAGYFTQLVAQLSTTSLGISVSDATLTIRWFAGETPDSRPEFSFHYSDSTGDFGWHHEPNPHVDGWGHFQERADVDDNYTYQPHTFVAENPTRIVWEVMANLTDKLQSE